MLKKAFSADSSTLHVYMCDFHIRHGAKQCTVCQRTTYHNTTNCSRYLTVGIASFTLYTRRKIARSKIFAKLFTRPSNASKSNSQNVNLSLNLRPIIFWNSYSEKEFKLELFEVIQVPDVAETQCGCTLDAGHLSLRTQLKKRKEISIS